MTNIQSATNLNGVFRGEIVVGFYFNSLEWMRIALSEFEKDERESYRHISEANLYQGIVGRVCFSYAMEFAYKALLLTQNVQFGRTHQVAKLHEKLPKAQQCVIEALALECVDTDPVLGFTDVQTMTSVLAGADNKTEIKGDQVIELIDRYCSDPNVKYGGFDADLDFHEFVIPIVDTRRTDRLRRLHGGVLQLAKELLLPDSQEFPTLAEVSADE